VPAEYLVGHIGDVLARDPRVADQGLHVSVSQAPLVVTVSGTLNDAGPRAGLAAVIAELLPGAELRDETKVADHTERGGPEEL
jgi:hypothetical protein